MKPTTISERMMFSTVKLETQSGSGTGFFFNFSINNSIVPVIITNNHVVNNKQTEKVKFSLHINSSDENSNENLSCEYTVDWFSHPKYDLCFTFFNPIFEDIQNKTGKQVFYIPVDESILASQVQLNELSQLEEVVMIGYPIGLSDSKNNFPIFRKGYTATHPAINFEGNSIGLVDMACFPGSSGSPIFVLNEHGYSDKKGNIYLDTSRVLLLGIQFAVPVYNSSGRIVLTTQVPTMNVITQQMTNLGYYIKSYELLELKKTIEKIIEDKEKQRKGL